MVELSKYMFLPYSGISLNIARKINEKKSNVCRRELTWPQPHGKMFEDISSNYQSKWVGSNWCNSLGSHHANLHSFCRYAVLDGNISNQHHFFLNIFSFGMWSFHPPAPDVGVKRCKGGPKAEVLQCFAVVFVVVGYLSVPDINPPFQPSLSSCSCSNSKVPTTVDFQIWLFFVFLLHMIAMYDKFTNQHF